METPKKKHLIELMIEAGVKWPDDAEYATQDKSTCKVHFYKGGKPVRSKVNNEAWSDAVSMCTWMGGELSIELPSLCNNWHQTIVTREQYEEALIKHNTAMSADTVEWYNPPSIEQLVSEYSRLQAISVEASNAAIEAAVTAAKALAQVKEAGKALGLSVELLPTKQPEPTPNITDWQDLQIGDVIKCVSQGKEQLDRLNWIVGEECKVIRTEEPGTSGRPIKAKFKNGEEWWIGEFRFIRRPSKE